MYFVGRCAIKNNIRVELFVENASVQMKITIFHYNLPRDSVAFFVIQSLINARRLHNRHHPCSETSSLMILWKIIESTNSWIPVGDAFIFILVYATRRQSDWQFRKTNHWKNWTALAKCLEVFFSKNLDFSENVH